MVVRVEDERLPQLFTKDWTDVPSDARVEQVHPGLARAPGHHTDHPRSAPRVAYVVLLDRLAVLGAPLRVGAL